MKDEFDEEMRVVGVVPAANIAWQMFYQTGYPGLYVFYRDLVDGERERSPLD